MFCFLLHLSILWCCSLMMNSLMMLVEVVHTGIIRQGKSFTNSVWFVLIFSFVWCDFCSVWNSIQKYIWTWCWERFVCVCSFCAIRLSHWFLFKHFSLFFFLQCVFRSINSAIVFPMSSFARFVWSDHVDFFVFLFVCLSIYNFFLILYTFLLSLSMFECKGK